MNNAKQIKDIADKLVSALGRKGFIIQRYDAFKTDSVYLKLDYGVCNSIRISDHSGKRNLQYRYNVLIGGELNIIEDVYIRYFYNEDTLKELYYQILLDKKIKVDKYGQRKYQSLMVKNQQDNKNKKGFWKESKVVTGNDITLSPVMPHYDDKETRQMPYGSYAIGPTNILDIFTQSIQQQQELDSNARFKENQRVKVNVPVDILRDYLATGGTYNLAEATRTAEYILKIPGNNIGTNLGATKVEEGIFYTIELPNIPMLFVPEYFLEAMSL